MEPQTSKPTELRVFAVETIQVTDTVLCVSFEYRKVIVFPVKTLIKISEDMDGCAYFARPPTFEWAAA